MIIKKTIGFNDLEEMGLNECLMVEKVHTAVVSGDKEALKDLIFNTVRRLEKNNISMENYYYNKYYPCSDELFDMFTLSTIEELFSTFGYEVTTEYIDGGIDSWEMLPEGYLAGTLKLSNGGYTFTTNIIHAMHDSLISMFVDVKDFAVMIDDSQDTPLKVISHEIETDIYEGKVLLSLEIEPSINVYEDIEKQILEVHFDEDTKHYICSRVYDFVDSDGDSDGGCYHNLNNKEIEFLKSYIEDNNLEFII